MFGYVWAILKLHGDPPQGSGINNIESEYKYYPFDHQGLIVTIDRRLWRGQVTERCKAEKSVVSYWPGSAEISSAIEGDCSCGDWLLMALSCESHAQTIDPQAPVELSMIPPHLKGPFSSGFWKAGFDVVDASGLSALTDVGYSSNDLLEIADMEININKYGLISEAADGWGFAKFASHAASEHSPFFPVEIWVKNCETISVESISF